MTSVLYPLYYIAVTIHQYSVFANVGRQRAINTTEDITDTTD